MGTKGLNPRCWNSKWATSHIRCAYIAATTNLPTSAHTTNRWNSVECTRIELGFARSHGAPSRRTRTGYATFSKKCRPPPGSLWLALELGRRYAGACLQAGVTTTRSVSSVESSHEIGIEGSPTGKYMPQLEQPHLGATMIFLFSLLSVSSPFLSSSFSLALVRSHTRTIPRLV